MGVGAHFGHEAEPLPPANAVLLNLLPEGGKKQPQINLKHKHIHVLPVKYLHKGLRKHFPLALTFWKGPDFDLRPFKEVKELEMRRVRRQRALWPGLLLLFPGRDFSFAVIF